MRLDDAETQLVGQLLAATVNEFYPTGGFDWDEVYALRERLAAEGVEVKTLFDPLPRGSR